MDRIFHHDFDFAFINYFNHEGGSRRCFNLNLEFLNWLSDKFLSYSYWGRTSESVVEKNVNILCYF